jgi:hypothetical protein
MNIETAVNTKPRKTNVFSRFAHTLKRKTGIIKNDRLLGNYNKRLHNQEIFARYAYLEQRYKEYYPELFTQINSILETIARDGPFPQSRIELYTVFAINIMNNYRDEHRISFLDPLQKQFYTEMYNFLLWLRTFNKELYVSPNRHKRNARKTRRMSRVRE